MGVRQQALRVVSPAVQALALNSGCKTEVDLPCGYIPRAIHVSQQGMHFVGLDLPATIQEASDTILSLVDPDKQGYARFAAADATNYGSIRVALEGVVLRHVGPAVMEVFQVTGFADFLNIQQ